MCSVLVKRCNGLCVIKNSRLGGKRPCLKRELTICMCMTVLHFSKFDTFVLMSFQCVMSEKMILFLWHKHCSRYFL